MTVFSDPITLSSDCPHLGLGVARQRYGVWFGALELLLCAPLPRWVLSGSSCVVLSVGVDSV